MIWPVDVLHQHNLPLLRCLGGGGEEMREHYEYVPAAESYLTCMHAQSYVHTSCISLPPFPSPCLSPFVLILVTLTAHIIVQKCEFVTFHLYFRVRPYCSRPYHKQTQVPNISQPAATDVPPVVSMPMPMPTIVGETDFCCSVA